MPVPKRRTGKAKKNMRRSHHAVTPANAIECPSCGAPVMPHRVCGACGHYRERLVISRSED